MKAWRYMRGGYWSQEDLSLPADPPGWEDQLKAAGYEEFGLRVGLDFGGLDGVNIWCRTRGDEGFLVDLTTAYQGRVILAPELPDLLELLVWLAPLLSVWVHTEELAARREEEAGRRRYGRRAL